MIITKSERIILEVNVNYKNMKLFSLSQIKDIIDLVDNELSEGDFPDDIRRFGFDKLIEKLEER